MVFGNVIKNGKICTRNAPRILPELVAKRVQAQADHVGVILELFDAAGDYVNRLGGARRQLPRPASASAGAGAGVMMPTDAGADMLVLVLVLMPM